MNTPRGLKNFFVFSNMDKANEAVDGVPPATSRGLVHAVLWCVGFAVIVVIGRVIAPAFAAGWALIALVVMAGVWKFYAPRFGIHRVVADAPHQLS